MSSALITTHVWKHLTRATNKAKGRGMAAVAYFGQGASKLLPLRSGSRLIVDASEGAVKSGQTCPKDLIALVKRGVRVFSVPNLHTKVFVFGRRAYVGSANVSNRSANTLVEAIVSTTDRETVKATRDFIQRLCLNELGPQALKRLDNLYEPPRVFGNHAQHRKTKGAAIGPVLRLSQTHRASWPDELDVAYNAGKKIARKKAPKRKGFVLDDLWWTGNCPVRVHDVVIQVLEEDNGKKYVYPPGTVISTHVKKKENKIYTFIYYEAIKRNRIGFERFVKLMKTTKKKLQGNGRVKDPVFAAKLLTTLNR